MTERPPYQQRVYDEKTELDERLAKLVEFIDHNQMFNAAPIEQQNLLIEQRGHMTAYSGVLRKRIAYWEQAEPKG